VTTPKAKVLIVEDEQIVASDIKRLLQNTGYDVIGIASTGEKAVRQATAGQPDLVLMDVKLKGQMDGIAAAAQIREQIDLPIIFLTAFSDEVTLQRAEVVSPYGYLLKPLNERELHAAIQMALHRHRAEMEIRQRNRELTLLNGVMSASIASSEPEQFLQITCRELAQAFDLSRTMALLLNADKSEATVVVDVKAPNLPELVNRSLPIRPDSPLQTMLREKVPLAIPDVAGESTLARVYPLLPELDPASLLLLPLIVEGDVMGLLAIGGHQGQHFSPSQIELGQRVAEQVGATLSRLELQRQRDQLSAVIEQMAESVVISDKQGQIIYVNPAFEQLTGYSRAEAVGCNPRILKSGRQPDGLYQELWQTISTGRIWYGQFVNKKKDGSFFTEEATITPIRDKQGQVVNYVAVKRDVTRELQLEEQYHQSQKMEAIGLLAGGIAHDFNNLLTAINGFAELMQLKLAPDSPGQELAGKILRAGHRAADLVRQLLAFSRRQIVEPRVVDLNALVGDVEKILGRLIGEHIRFETILAADLGLIQADPNQLEQIILNLVVNARDAMPDGGHLTIETANVVLDADDMAKHFELEPGEYVMLTVSDTGCGMSDDVKARIFEPFFTTKEMGKGTGLGLATVFGIVKQNKGYIWVYSEARQGTSFKIYLPRVAQASLRPSHPHRPEPLPRGSETILLVEDEQTVRELAAEMLRGQGYQVLEAKDGFEALGLADELNGDLNLLVTDVIMPKMNGRELADKIAETQPNLKILFVSGYTDEMIARHGVLEAGVEFIQKPFTSASLANKVHQLLTGTGQDDYA
jgi:PAS domain S-box-containing protein